MDYIEFLGTCGTRTVDAGAMSIRVSEHTVVDAGNLVYSLKDDMLSIENIFLTHAHMDHICDIPFLVEQIVEKSSYSLKIYALQETINSLRKHIFNDEIWPDFEKIKLLNGSKNTIEFITIELNKSYQVDNISLTPIRANHTDGSCGYIIEKKKKSILVMSDTYINDEVWDRLNSDKKIHSLCIDLSFSSDYEELAKNSKHLTPQLLLNELKKLYRKDIAIFPIHIKPSFYKNVVKEIQELNILKRRSTILKDGDKLYFDFSKDVQRSQ